MEMGIVNIQVVFVHVGTDEVVQVKSILKEEVPVQGPEELWYLEVKGREWGQQMGWKCFPRRKSGVLRKTKPVFLNNLT